MARHMGYDVAYTKTRWNGQMKHFRHIYQLVLAPSHHKSAKHNVRHRQQTKNFVWQLH